MSMTMMDAMRLADEIGLPDYRGDFVHRYARDWGGEKPPSCAIGGANIAVGRAVISPDDDGWVPSTQHIAAGHWWGPVGILTDCPVCALANAYPLHQLTAHLYDDHEWSRTQVADWLDALMVRISRSMPV
jgi:hypothetical protein